jgi:hypothetical protein
MLASSFAIVGGRFVDAGLENVNVIQSLVDQLEHVSCPAGVKCLGLRRERRVAVEKDDATRCCWHLSAALKSSRRHGVASSLAFRPRLATSSPSSVALTHSRNDKPNDRQTVPSSRESMLITENAARHNASDNHPH